MGTFVPTTAAEREQMLRTIGASSVEELFRDVPQQMYLDGYLNLPPGKSEQETFEAVSIMCSRPACAVRAATGIISRRR